jgi:DNA excision repair protein ERCC-6
LLPVYHRIILSGTPIQNSLKELWNLIDFVYPGRLGTLEAFDTEFAHPIRVGGYLNATVLEKEIAVRSATTLQRILKPFLLRRKKDELQLATKLPKKHEQVLFCSPSDLQRSIYREIIDSPEVAAVLRRRATAFRAISALRKLCNHPALVFENGRIAWEAIPEENDEGVNDEILGDEEDDEADDSSMIAKRKKASGNRARKKINSGEGQRTNAITKSISTKAMGTPTKRIAWSDSGKLFVLSKILPLWSAEGHKVLVFAQTLSMLDLIESMIKELSFTYVRIDGHTSIHRRTALVDQFNYDSGTFIALLTTRTGGVGISLIGANRVILVFRLCVFAFCVSAFNDKLPLVVIFRQIQIGIQ